MREAGVLMPVFSMPSRYGIGDFGKESYQFVDYLKQMGFKVWQILPLNPLGYGNSPYQPYSSYAGDEIYISLDFLQRDGLLKEEVPSFQKYSTKVDYDKVRKFKEQYLKKAFENFKGDNTYLEFCKQEWVRQYAIFITFKKENELKCWNEWPEQYQNYLENKAIDLEKYQNKIEYEIFLQYIFFKQWMELKSYANQAGIQVMGDIPFYVGTDSLDVWGHKENFLLDDKGHPTFIAGVPPDLFSKTGQRWGNPIYNWEQLKKDQYKFWIDRITYSGTLFDIVRIDHFRAFDTYWKIPVSCPTAVDGEWVEAPGYEVFDELGKRSDVKIVVEDLGNLRQEVRELRDHYNLKGMGILQYAFGKDYIERLRPRKNSIFYTGNHDNQTIWQWYHDKSTKQQRRANKILKENGCKQRKLSHRFIAYAMNTVADLVVIPVADIINQDEKGRINTPSTIGSPNWEWKLRDFSELQENILSMKKIIVESKRN